MKTMLIAVALVVSGAALAASPQPTPQPQPQAQPQPQPQGWQRRGEGPGQGPGRDSPEARQRREQRTRMMQVVGLSEALGLSTQEALRVDETLRRFDDRRRPFRDQVHESGKVVMDAARGDNAALAQVDQATNRLLDARIQLASLDKELFQALARDLNPQQRAKLALFYARFHKGMKAFKARGFEGGDGNEGRFRPWKMRRGQRLGEVEAAPSDLGAVAGGDVLIPAPEGLTEE